MNKIIDCISKNSYTKDGVLISGHECASEVAFTDRETGKTYYVDKCVNCGKYEVLWDRTASEIKQYEQVRQIG